MGDDRRCWTSASLASPHQVPDKATRVRRMFDTIAPRYQLINSLFSGGRDAAWRRRAAQLAGVRADDLVLDIACGTGDFAQVFRRAGAGGVVGCDFSHEMLKLAARGPRHRIQPSTVFHKFHDDRSGGTAERSAAILSTPRQSMPAPSAWAWRPARLVARLLKRNPRRASGGMAERSAAMLSTPRQGMPAPSAWAWHPARWCQADALRLPFRTGSFSVATCAFGVRNFENLDVGLAEM
ncbi:MAG: class I SAM-dependent methyltransferase, partial [Phycisphaerae bacterium]